MALVSTKSKGLSLEEAAQLYRHEKRFFRRKGEDQWCSIHEDKIIRMGPGSQSSIRGIKLEDALAKDWEMMAVYRSLSADELRDAMLAAIRAAGQKTMSPMEYLEKALIELELL